MSLVIIFLCSIFPKIYRYYRRYRIKRAISTSSYKPKIIIIGAGFSGIATAIKLKYELGYDNFIILERNSSVGGTSLLIL